jgi:hypothetical protein
MNYPVWVIPSVGGSLPIAVISILHVYVAHFAVGGGLFLVLSEIKGLRENSPQILEYTKRHAKFFLLLTMVFGGVTGVGIWFIIALVHPQATSALIHSFVFGWATEWVFFVGEIVALFVYFYTFGRMGKRNHLIVGWLYFVFAWLSLFVINGIVAFMLTPGAWIGSQDFWAGLFNPSFLPSLFFRTALAFMLAGLFGFLTAATLKEQRVRETMVRYCARWLAIPILLMPLFSFWYLNAIGGPSKALILKGSPEIVPFAKTFIWVLPLLFLGGLAMAVRMRPAIKRPLAFLLVLLGLAYMGSFEWIREAARRPYVISHHLYSNSVMVSQQEAINREGMLSRAKWVRHRDPSGKDALASGRELFNLQCLSCHSVGGILNDILPRTAKFGLFGMDAMLDGLGKINTYMPPFMGTLAERKALALYVVKGLHGRSQTRAAPPALPQLPLTIPDFNEAQSAYVLLAWSNLGMHCMSDNSRYFVASPPGNTLYAQLIKRGETPEIVTEGVAVTFRVEPGFERPSQQVDFWKHAKALLGRDLKPDTGLDGKGMAGNMDPDTDQGTFVAKRIPVVPYSATGAFNPYPLFTIEAKDKQTGKVLASTQCVAPVSTEMGCRNCHGGPWRKPGTAGLSNETARDILKVHDRMNRTRLLASADEGRPRMCQNCHGDPALGAKGKPSLLNLSAAIHGLHANYLTKRGAAACNSCHPSSAGSRTQCFRGIHARKGITCISCHGTLEDHALSLLKAEQQAGKPGAGRLMRHLRPRQVAGPDRIRPRTPWVNEPDCLSCHVGHQQPKAGASAFNKWTRSADELVRMRTGEAGIRCLACHGSTHALYPARNPYGKDRDNLQPLQYQKTPYPIGANKDCKVCHTIDMEEEMHHPNILRMFRNTRIK